MCGSLRWWGVMTPLYLKGQDVLTAFHRLVRRVISAPLNPGHFRASPVCKSCYLHVVAFSVLCRRMLWWAKVGGRRELHCVIYYPGEGNKVLWRITLNGKWGKEVWEKNRRISHLFLPFTSSWKCSSTYLPFPAFDLLSLFSCFTGTEQSFISVDQGS